MSNSIKNQTVKKRTKRSTSELYKELEVTNIKHLLMKTPEISQNAIPTITDKIYQNWMPRNKVGPEQKSNNYNEELGNHYVAFQKAMKLLLIIGQLIGLNPVIGVMEKKASKMRFKTFSWRFLYSTIICIAQASATVACFYALFTKFNIKTLFLLCSGFLASLAFNLTTFLTTVFFMRIATKWPWLALEVSKTTLNEYTDQRLKKKCDVISVTLMTTVEHILSWIARIGEILDCHPDKKELYRAYIELTFPWLFDLGVPYCLPMGIILQFFNFISTMNWNYSDLFIMCMSFYLTSILDRINSKIILCRGKYLPSTFWCSLREDYNRATRLVRSFDIVISSIIFASFASNLFFICLQLFNLLANGIKHDLAVDLCPNFPSGPFNGYEHATYFTYSLIFMLIRSLGVCLIAASVHSASLVPAPALYDVPSPAYCSEVQRFLEQVHGDTVALSGLQFFHVTKGLVLSVAGTIVTYELVLLQFNDDAEVKKT